MLPRQTYSTDSTWQVAFIAWWVQCFWSPPVISGSTIRLCAFLQLLLCHVQDEEQGLHRKLWPSGNCFLAKQQMTVRWEFSPAAVILGGTLATELSKCTCNLGVRHNYWYSLKSHMSQWPFVITLYLAISIIIVPLLYQVPVENVKRHRLLRGIRLP